MLVVFFGPFWIQIIQYNFCFCWKTYRGIKQIRRTYVLILFESKFWQCIVKTTLNIFLYTVENWGTFWLLSPYYLTLVFLPAKPFFLHKTAPRDKSHSEWESPSESSLLGQYLLTSGSSRLPSTISSSSSSDFKYLKFFALVFFRFRFFSQLLACQFSVGNKRQVQGATIRLGWVGLNHQIFKPRGVFCEEGVLFSKRPGERRHLRGGVSWGEGI